MGRRLHATEVAEKVRRIQESISCILHRIADLDLKPKAAGIDAVIYGHSHQPLIEWRDGVLYSIRAARGLGASRFR